MSEVHICTPDYVAKLEDAKRRIAANMKQGRCPRCFKWFWPDDPHSFDKCKSKEWERVMKREMRKGKV